MVVIWGWHLVCKLIKIAKFTTICTVVYLKWTAADYSKHRQAENSKRASSFTTHNNKTTFKKLAFLNDQGQLLQAFVGFNKATNDTALIINIKMKCVLV